MQLRNKSHEIKKFHHVLKGYVQLFYWAEVNLGVVMKIKVAQEGILN